MPALKRGEVAKKSCMGSCFDGGGDNEKGYYRALLLAVGSHRCFIGRGSHRQLDLWGSVQGVRRWVETVNKKNEWKCRSVRNVSKSEPSLAHFGSSVIMCEGPPCPAQELAPTIHAWQGTHRSPLQHKMLHFYRVHEQLFCNIQMLIY